MSLYFLDTYALFELFKGSENYNRFQNDVAIITTPLNLMEFYYILLRINATNPNKYYDRLVKFVVDKKTRVYRWGFVGTAMDDVIMGWAWPVFMFLVIGDFEQLGSVVSAVMLISMLTTLLAGRWFDIRRGRGGLADEKMFWAGSVLTAVTRFTRSLAASVWGVFGWDALNKIVAPFYWLPFGGYLYSAAKRHKPLAFFAYREIVYSLGRIVMAGLVISLIGLPFGWQWVFGTGAVGVLLGAGMATESNK